MRILFAFVLFTTFSTTTAWAAQPPGEKGNSHANSQATAHGEDTPRVRAENKELIFRDSHGKELKRIKAGPENGPAYVEKRKARKRGRTGREFTYNQKILRHAAVSRTANAAIVAETTLDFIASESSTSTIQVEDDLASQSASSNLEYYDENGNLKWKKDLRKKMEIFDKAISDDGRTIMLIEGCNLGCADLTTRNRLVVLNENGDEIISIVPRKGESEIGSPPGQEALAFRPGMNVPPVAKRRRSLACSGHAQVLDRLPHEAPVAISPGLGTEVSQEGIARQSGQPPQGAAIRGGESERVAHQ